MSLMNLKRTAVAAALSLTAASSFASSFSFDGSSPLTFSFDVGSASSIDAVVTSSVVNGYGFDITSVTFDGMAFAGGSITFGSQSSDAFFYSASLVSPGMHSISVYGTPLGSTYHGNVVLTPVPEPETYALLLAGLGVVGFTAGRRRRD